MSKIVLFFIILLILCCLLSAQTTGDWFPIYLPADDGFIPDDRTNWFFPELQQTPAGAHGFLTVDSEGHFRFEDGTPIRFAGVSLVAGAAFPDSATAIAVAARLAKLGINLVRLHHIDNSWSSDARESLILPGSNTRTLNPEQFAKLDFFIQQLAPQGIYTCMSLHSARRFLPGDGIAGADSLPINGKAVTLFDPRLIELQKEHVMNVLGHVNPYTGLRYARDPRIALFEITNENTLYGAWLQDLLNGRRVYGSGLSAFHQRMLDSLWQDFLIQKYGNEQTLAVAWQSGALGSPGEELVRNGDFENAFYSEWILELHNNATAMLERGLNQIHGNYAARIVTQKTNSVWDVQLKQIGLPVQKDSIYILSFWAGTESPQKIRVAVFQDDNPEMNLGLDQEILLPSGLVGQTFSLSFTATQTNLTNARLTFALGGEAKTIWIDRVRLQRKHIGGLKPEESLAGRNVKRIEYRDRQQFTAARVRDTAEFYEHTQRRFFVEMYRHIKEKIGANALISAGNIYGGPADAKSVAVADYSDNHAYWDHPQYPNTIFDRYNWVITNQPMVRQIFPLGNTVTALAARALANKPYTVSEYNHPFPNQYQAEAIPFLLAYSSLQNWEALLLFSYHQGASRWEATSIPDNFQIDGNPLMMAMLPQFSHVYRNSLIRRAQREVTLKYTNNDVYLYDFDLTGLLGVRNRLDENLALVHRLRIGDFDSSTQMTAADYGVATLSSPYISDTGEIEWDQQTGLLKVETPQVVMLSGFLQEQMLAMARLNLLSADHFGSVVWTSTTTHSLEQTDKSLMTVVTRAENRSMRWNSNRTGLNSWGTSPVLLEAQRLLLEFKLPVDSIWVFPLDSLGRATSHQSYQPDANGLIRVQIDQRKTPAVWFGLRHFVKPTSVATPHSRQPKAFALYQSFPNPIVVPNAAGSRVSHEQVTIRFDLPEPSPATLILYDLTGREVRRLVDGVLDAGPHEVAFFVADLPNGVYFYRLKTRQREMVRKLAVVR